jgi:hypothetical protein
MKANGLLRTYLQDHHAGATGGVELARRAAASNEDHPSGGELAAIAEEIEEDRDVLERVMEELEIGPSSVKDGVAWTAEKVGRLKPNNRLIGYSPLSRVVELEGLLLGVSGKLALWEALQAAVGAQIEGVDFRALALRAQEQRTRLERLRREAAAEALAVE